MVELSVDAFDKALIIYVKGPVAADDIKCFDEELPALYAEFAYIFLSFDKAEVQEALLASLAQVRDKHGWKKDRVMICSKSHKQVDFTSLKGAIEDNNTSDALRIGDLLIAEREGRKLKKDVKALALEYANVLRVAAGQSAGDEPLGTEEEMMLRRLFEDRVKKAQYLYRVVGSEISAMKKSLESAMSESERAQKDQTVKQIKTEALAAIKKASTGGGKK